MSIFIRQVKTCLPYVFLLGIISIAITAWGQAIPIANPSFEQGEEAPEGWRLSGGEGGWFEDAAVGAHAVSVNGEANSQASTYWYTEPVSFEPNACYRFTFQARRLGGSGGSPITGPTFCNRDLHEVTSDWKSYASYFVAPSKNTAAALRLGQWNAEGTIAFDDVSLVGVAPVYLHRNGVALGDGESITGNEYVFTAPLTGDSANHARTLQGYDCSFNKPRWVFSNGSWVVYHHEVAGIAQTSGEVEVTIGYYQGGRLVVEASNHGENWVEVGSQNDMGTLKIAVPDVLFPAASILIRFAATSSDNAAVPVNLQIHGYTYRASLESAPGDFHGKTTFVAVPKSDGTVRLSFEDLGEGIPGGNNAVQFSAVNLSDNAVTITPHLKVASGQDTALETTSAPVTLPADSEEAVSVTMPYEVAGAGDVLLTLDLGDEVAYRAEAGFNISCIFESGYGMTLPDSSDAVALWWASSGWKISRTRPTPTEHASAMRIQLAQNEREAAQFVLRPETSLHQLRVIPQHLETADGSVLPAASIEVLRVGYVSVTQPTDYVGAVASWPDPLPPVTAPMNLKDGENQPFWVCVHASADTPAGTYRGDIVLEADGWKASVPLEVEVFNFALPDRKTCTSAFGFDAALAFRYHNVSSEADRRRVYESYLSILSDHHISIYNPAVLDPIQYDWPHLPRKRDGEKDSKDGTAADMATISNVEAFTPEFDWTAWDAAMTRAFDHYHFNAFALPVPGMGGGTFHSRHEPSLLGYGEDTPEYKAAFTAWCSAVETHLQEKGWLDDSYVYWFDEPEPPDYEFVMNGFRKLKEAAPGFGRMLTEQIEPELVGGPNIWCPLSQHYDYDMARERQAAGEKIWWYVCTGPKAPYATLFIDHPATELRVWLWQTWERAIDGILIWQTNYWHSDEAYPDAPQNPYEDPMGWTTGYSTPVGAKRPWGNGDGRFIYPPLTAADGQPEAPVFDDPVISIRLEMLRDGIEDYEYCVILRGLLGKHKERLSEEELKKYQKLLDVPNSITQSVTEFTWNPEPIEAHREAVARAVAKLNNL